MERYRDKVAVVTGAGAGIGAATARRLASEGAKVVIADLNPDAGEAVAKEIVAAGGQAKGVRTDVSDRASLEAMVKVAVEAFGGVDVLVNNAALQGAGEDRDVLGTPEAIWRKMMDVNVFGIVEACKLIIPLMIARGGGAILNISSGVAVRAEPVRVAYGTSKAAVLGLTRNIAAGYAREGVRCNAIAPGLIPSPTKDLGRFDSIAQTIPMGRMGRPEEIAATVAYLCSDDASYVTGQVIGVDGGLINLSYYPKAS